MAVNKPLSRASVLTRYANPGRYINRRPEGGTPLKDTLRRTQVEKRW
jgi:hypothetical protein